MGAEVRRIRSCAPRALPARDVRERACESGARRREGVESEGDEEPRRSAVPWVRQQQRGLTVVQCCEAIRLLALCHHECRRYRTTLCGCATFPDTSGYWL